VDVATQICIGSEVGTRACLGARSGNRAYLGQVVTWVAGTSFLRVLLQVRTCLGWGADTRLNIELLRGTLWRVTFVEKPSSMLFLLAPRRVTELA